jgi:hypothetical protein
MLLWSNTFGTIEQGSPCTNNISPRLEKAEPHCIANRTTAYGIVGSIDTSSNVPEPASFHKGYKVDRCQTNTKHKAKLLYPTSKPRNRHKG